jgi:hypothetical protein
VLNAKISKILVKKIREQRKKIVEGFKHFLFQVWYRKNEKKLQPLVSEQNFSRKNFLIERRFFQNFSDFTKNA